MGPKPSITLHLTNLDTTDYVVDLLVYDKSGNGYSSELCCNDSNGDKISEEIKEKLHSINYDGWISEGTRWYYYLLMTEMKGNIQHEHYFRYFGTPEEYKVITIFGNGSIRVSDTIYRKDFTSSVTLDVNTMEYKEIGNTLVIIIEVIIDILLTILVEYLVAKKMNIVQKLNLRNIICINIFTQLFLQLLIRIISIPYILLLVLLEMCVIIFEYLLYNKFSEFDNKKLLFKYVLIANLLSLICSIIIPIIISVFFLNSGYWIEKLKLIRTF